MLRKASAAKSSAEARRELLPIVKDLLTNGNKDDRLLAEAAAVKLHRRQDPKSIAGALAGGKMKPVRAYNRTRSGVRRIDRKPFGLVDEHLERGSAEAVARRLRAISSLPDGRKVKTYARIIPTTHRGRKRYAVYLHSQEAANPHIQATRRVKQRWKRR